MQILERERVLVPAEKFSSDFLATHKEIVSRVKECPSMIPPH
jgi:hypothetical protein